jgi:sucrose phosphorylase
MRKTEIEEKNMTDINKIENGPMLNLYPDSLGGDLEAVADLFERDGFADAFSSIYILPSIYHSDLDRGFSVIDYDLEEAFHSEKALLRLGRQNIDLKLDFVLNHASVQSPQFQDLLENGSQSEYRDFFIDWNAFWENCGEMTEDGYIQPAQKYLDPMFFRKPGLPLLMVEMADGSRIPYWNTFYQEIRDTDDYHTRYLGQMDLNIKSEKVWDFYRETIKKLAGYGAKIIRLDAFAYAPKAPGRANFLNEPETWEFLEQIHKLAKPYGIRLLPEIHAGYKEKKYELIAQKGYLTYDFFLPGLILDALYRGDGTYLEQWAKEQIKENIHTVNMLGCHDGIPVLDLAGLLPDDRIEDLIRLLVDRGGFVKDLHGNKKMYYQVNTTYYNALGENEQALLLARALQIFMPGKPQVWYLDLFAGSNDYEAVKRAGAGGHKEINRTNFTQKDIESGLKKEVVKKQLEMLKFRKEFPAFGFDAEMEIRTKPAAQISDQAENALHFAKIPDEQMYNRIYITWKKDGYLARLSADLKAHTYRIQALDPSGNLIWQMF